MNSSRQCTYAQDARYLNKPTRTELQRLEAHIDSLWDMVREKEQAEGDHDSLTVPQSEPNIAGPIVQTPAQARERENTSEEETKENHQSLSLAEVDIVGNVSPGGDLVVHEVSSMHHRQQQEQQGRHPSHAHSMDIKGEAKVRERQQHQQTSKAQLVANAAFQRQRESVLLRNPSLMQQVNFGPIDPGTAMHLLDLHFNRLHFT